MAIAAAQLRKFDANFAPNHTGTCFILQRTPTPIIRWLITRLWSVTRAEIRTTVLRHKPHQHHRGRQTANYRRWAPQTYLDQSRSILNKWSLRGSRTNITNLKIKPNTRSSSERENKTSSEKILLHVLNKLSHLDLSDKVSVDKYILPAQGGYADVFKGYCSTLTGRLLSNGFNYTLERTGTLSR